MSLPRSYLPRFFLFGLVLVAACMAGPRPPKVVPQQTLGPEALDLAARPSEGPFAVVAGSPRGETEIPSEISLIFNRPMRALELAGDEAAPPVTLTPVVPGRWQWVGTSALQFVPEGTLPYATEFRVTVPQGTQALDGSTLAERYELTFSTPRPEPVDSEPSPYESLTPDSTFTVRFNQPVADAEILRSFRIVTGGKKKERSIPFDVRRTDPENLKLAVLVPKQKLPLDSEIVVRASADLRGIEGPLPAGKGHELTYRTYGPLALQDLACDTDTPTGRCNPRRGVGVQLTNAVKYGDLRRAIELDPPVEMRFDEFEGDDSQTTWIHVGASFRPNSTYTLRIRKQLPDGKPLVDEYGQALAEDIVRTIRTDHFWPEVEIGMSGAYLEAAVARDIPVLAVNTSYELAVAKLDPNAIVELEKDRYDRRSAIARLGAVTKAKARVVPASPKRDEATTELVRIAEVLGGRRGVMAIAYSYVQRPGTKQQHVDSRLRIVQVTDLGISAKLSEHGSIVWVTRLSTGEPVSGANVEIRLPDGSSVGPFVTDGDGLAQIPADKYRLSFMSPEGIVFVRRDDDWAYRRLSEDVGSYAFGAERDWYADELPLGLIFTDRGIYRPGDLVKVKGIVREPASRGLSTPAGKKLRITIAGPEGDEIQNQEVTLNEFGTFALDVRAPRTGRLGSYQIQGTFEGSSRGWGEVVGHFEVAEYRPAEFEVEVKSDRDTYVRGDTARFFGRAAYLFGEPMGEANAHYRIIRAPAHFTVPGMPTGFVTSDDAWHVDFTEMAPDTHLLQSGDSQLDGSGQIELSQKLAFPGQRGPERVRTEVEVKSLSNQYITGQKAALVHPGEFYLAVRKPHEGFVDAKQPLRIEVLAARPDGTRERNARVHLDLVKRTWKLARQTSESSVHNVVQPVDETVGGCDVTTAAEPVSCDLVPPTAGYYLVRAKTKDKRGNEIAASLGAYVFGAGASGFGDNDNLRVDLVPDRESYEVGQTARVLVKSPFQSAEALVTVERAGIYSQRRMKLEGPMPVIEVPITDELRPNAFVSVLLVRGRSKGKPENPKAPDLGAPTFRLGFANLVVDPKSRRLQVKVTPNRKELGPGDTVEVALQVTNAEGKGERAEVTLYAVDEAVLSLIGYKTPDPIPVFNAPRLLRTLTLESRESLAKIFTIENPELGLDKGDPGGGGAEGARRDFRQTVHFDPSLVTDENGRAKASFKLPDSLTSYRIMAVAVGTTDRFGFGEERITAKKALMARPSLPRFLRAGDRFEAGVVVSAAEKGRVEVEAVAEGVELLSPARTSVDLEPNRSELVRFTYAAKQAGSARFTFRVKGRGATDAVEVRREVTAPAVLESVALYGDTSSASGEALGDLSALRSDVGGLDISMASTALVGLDTSIAELVEYPFTCTEQQVSRLVPLVSLRDLARDFGFAPPQGADEIVAKSVASILSAQRYDGGFGSWPDSPSSDPFVTTYALWGLGEAKRHGVTIPARAIDDATRYVRRQLENWQKTGIGPALGAFIVDVLAMNGSPDPGWESRLFEARDKLPVFGRALLAHAMAVSKGHPDALAELSRELKNHLRLDGPVATVATNEGDAYAVLLDSDTRTTALVLRALLAIDPNEPLASKLAQGLLASRKGGGFRTTQEAAWSLLALGDYRRAQERPSPNFDANVFLGDSLLVTAGFHGRSAQAQSTSVPASKLVSAGGSTLAFEVQGQGTLFYQARLRYARKELPRDLLDRGFFVRQSLRAVTPEEVSAALRTVGETSANAFQAGDLVLADVVVVTPSPREQVVVEAPLPAGFEAVDTRLATTASYLSVPPTGYDEYGYEDVSYDDVAMGRSYLPSWVRQEVRDDRVLFFVEHMAAGMYRYRYLARATTPGSFVVPPLRAFEMYAPEVFGRTGASTIEVRE